MKSSFNLLRPTSVDEAVELKSRHGPTAKFWAGGTDMMLLWENELSKFDYAIDLTLLNDLKFIEERDDCIRIGALATLDDLERSPATNHIMKVLSETARVMCTKQTRTIATIGGNMCHAAPSADLSPPIVALDSEAQIVSRRGVRTESMESFFTGVKQTVLTDDEMLRAISIPKPVGRSAASYIRVARTVVDIALVASSAAITVDANSIVTSARIVLGAAAPVPLRVRSAEKMIEGTYIDTLSKDVVNKAGALAASKSRPISDIRTSEDYRREMCNVLTRRALADCVLQLGGAVQ